MVNTFKASALQKAYHLGRSDEFILGGREPCACFSIRLNSFDKDRFEAAVNKTVSRHILLHSFYNGEKWEELETVNIQPEYIRAQGDISSMKKDIEEKLMSEENSFDRNNMMKVNVLTDENNTAHIFFLFSGLVLDGMSAGLFIKEVYAHYCGLPVEGPADIRDHFASEKEYMSSPRADEDKAFFRDLFGETELSEVKLPLKTQVENINAAHNDVVYAVLGDELYSAVRDKSISLGVTPFAFLMTVFSYVISKYSDSDRYLLNIPCSVRNRAIPGIENTIGLCSNFMLFPVNILRDRSVKENIIDIQMKLLDIQEHMFYSGAEAVRDAREITGIDLPAPVVFTDLLGFCDDGDDIVRESWRINTNQVILEADLVKLDNTPVLALNYVSELLEGYVVRGIADTFIDALKVFCEKESALECSDISICENDKRIIQEFNSTDETIAEKSLSEVLLESFEKYSVRKAVVNKGKALTYAELKNRALELNTYMAENYKTDNGLKAAILLPKCSEQVIAAVAVVLSDGAYMPVDTEMPCEQIKRLFDNIRPDIIISDDNGIKKLEKIGYENILDIGRLPVSYAERRSPDLAASGEDTRIIINTSGSTGIPKSVMLKDSSIVGCLSDSVKVFGLNDGDCVLSVTNFAHDMAIFDTLGIFFFGGCCVIPDSGKVKEPEHWFELMKENKVTLWNSVPAIMEMLMLYMEDKALRYDDMRRVMLGGDFFRPALANRIKDSFKSSELFNVGGPTETTIWNISHKVTDEDIENELIPYGRPFPNTRYHILDSKREICPVGVKGTMFVTGRGVSKGYIGNDDETSKRFTELFSQRSYDTGDMGILLPGGEIKICGRTDGQIKINGKRIELSAVENVICEMQGIRSAVVIYTPGNKRMNAFFTADKNISADELRDFMSSKVAEYMIPKRFTQLGEIPVTSNGKPDKKRLAEISENTGDEIKNSETNDGIQNNIRDTILSFIKEELDDDTIDESMNFYMAGGDSLAAVKLSAKIGSTYDIKVSVYDIIDSADISSLLDELCTMTDDKKA